MKNITKDVSSWEVGGFSVVTVAWVSYELFKLKRFLPPEDVPNALFLLAFLSVIGRSVHQKWQAKQSAK
jgi:hypothetical protein